MNTNDATRANAKALPEISRRRFLLNTTMAGAVVAVASPVAAAEPEMTPLERIAAAQAELIAAAKIAFPEVTDWRVLKPEDDNPGTPFMFMIVGHNWSAKGRKGGAA